MSDIDQQFIEYVVKSLVGKPDAVHIDRRIDEKGVLLELTVDPEDLGRVIGKRGATAQSLRTLLRALGTKNDARYNLKIIDNGEPGHGHSNDNSSSASVQPSEPTGNAKVSDMDDTHMEPAHEAAAQPKPEAKPQPAPEAEASDRLKKARAELADLDD